MNYKKSYKNNEPSQKTIGIALVCLLVFFIVIAFIAKLFMSYEGLLGLIWVNMSGPILVLLIMTASLIFTNVCLEGKWMTKVSLIAILALLFISLFSLHITIKQAKAGTLTITAHNITCEKKEKGSLRTPSFSESRYWLKTEDYGSYSINRDTYKKLKDQEIKVMEIEIYYSSDILIRYKIIE